MPYGIEIVIELAKRGIISSICSKNDYEKVKTVLSNEELWDFFVFPSINWLPKGPRLQYLISHAQLRAATVLYIDDNPSNREEAKQFNPEIQVADVEILPRLLADPLLIGKVDVDLNRLKQYRSLDQRKVDESHYGGGVEAFLRRSGIRVQISYEFADHLDRIIDLINRTNQLNFTKIRLPPDLTAARTQINHLLQSHDIQAGLLRVEDRYGDHGFAGFYMLRNSWELLHFCFSCRVLGMGIETWLYQRLGRPGLTISGEVLTDPT